MGRPPTARPPSNPGEPAPGTIPHSASDLLKQTLIDWGLQSLLPHLQDYIKKGYDSNTINLGLQDTKEWKIRFAGNELRKANGLAVLTPAQYIATEEQYRNVLQSYGLPAGFYDKHSDFDKFIGNDVSPAEIQARAQVAHDQYLNAPAEYKQMWQQYYGLDAGHAIASILDPKIATQVINDRAATVGLGATAAQNGFNVDLQRAQQFQQHGTTLAQAQKAYQFLGQNFNTDQQIAKRFNQQFGQTQEENDLLLGQGPAAQERQVLYGQEKDLFAGHAAADNASLGVSQGF